MSTKTFMQLCGIGCVALAAWGMWPDLKRFPRQMWTEIHDTCILPFGGVPESQHTPLNALDPDTEGDRIAAQCAGSFSVEGTHNESFDSDRVESEEWRHSFHDYLPTDMRAMAAKASSN